MAKAIRIYEYGGPEVLQYEDVDIAAPGPHEVRLRQTAIGLNYIDVYHRTGLYPLAALPATIGMEAAAIVEAVGDAVTEFKVGDRVAYASGPLGAYAEERIMPVDRLVALPDAISDQQAAAIMLQGMTVEYLIRRTYPVKSGDLVLLHAAAGGVGLLACQWLRHIGATVIGTVGSEAKATLAKQHGCTHTINYQQENIAERVREITKGDGVAVVYDSVGKDTFEASLDSLRPRGMLVSFGNASGPVPAFEPAVLAQRGSLYFTRPSLMTYTASREDLQESARALFEVIENGVVKASVNQTYPLAATAQAHRDLEARKTTGSTVLTV